MTDKEKKQSLIDAAQLLQDVGWIQGNFYRPREGYCAAGAISHVAGGLYTDESAASRNFFLRYLRIRYGSDVKDIAQWNDESKRTKEEVIDTLRKASAH